MEESGFCVTKRLSMISARQETQASIMSQTVSSTNSKQRWSATTLPIILAKAVDTGGNDTSLNKVRGLFKREVVGNWGFEEEERNELLITVVKKVEWSITTSFRWGEVDFLPIYIFQGNTQSNKLWSKSCRNNRWKYGRSGQPFWPS